MGIFKIHTKDSAPTELAEIFEDKQKKIGFVPNIFGAVAESIPATKAFDTMSDRYSQCSFTATEKETIEIVTSIENGCGYCVAGHTAFAKMQHVPDHIIRSLRENEVVDDFRIQALADFVKKIIRSKGKITQKDFILFFDAGFTKSQVIEVMLGISLKNFTNHVSNAVSLPLDDAFAPHAWTQQDDHADFIRLQNAIPDLNPLYGF